MTQLAPMVTNSGSALLTLTSLAADRLKNNQKITHEPRTDGFLH